MRSRPLRLALRLTADSLYIVADKDGIRRINLDGSPYEPPQPPPIQQAQAGAAEQAEAMPVAAAPEVAATA